MKGDENKHGTHLVLAFEAPLTVGTVNADVANGTAAAPRRNAGTHSCCRHFFNASRLRRPNAPDVLVSSSARAALVRGIWFTTQRINVRTAPSSG